MRFAWDRRKSEENRHLRGFDFGFATSIFDGFVVARPDLRREYGELRMVAIGIALGREWTVVYTDRLAYDGEVERRIISARRSNKQERVEYAEASAKKSES